MSKTYTANDLLNALAAASKTLSERKDEINRLNVFPVPDGDTGTNMSLTLGSVVENLARLPIGTDGAKFARRSRPARSWVPVGIPVLSPRKFCADCARAAQGAKRLMPKASTPRCPTCTKKKLSTEETLEAIVDESYASVQRTPDLLPVLKENGVVDAGGFGLSMFARSTAPKVEIEQINDWEGSEYRYCTEFLVHSDTLDVDAAKAFLPTMGDCDLLLGGFLTHDAQISEVHVHNMQLQSAARNDVLAAEHEAERKPLGFVAVAAGEGMYAFHERPARRCEPRERRCRHHSAEQLEHHHGGAERLLAGQGSVRGRSHQERAAGLRGAFRRGRAGEP